jgi:periplasmic divalent cation tolerance protein
MSLQQPLLVFTNMPDAPSARALAHKLLEQQLAACVNYFPPMMSIYRWQGAIEEAAEVPLLIKTTQARYSELEAVIKASHPYDVPEIIATPIVAGWPAYLEWIIQETMNKDSDVQDDE